MLLRVDPTSPEPLHLQIERGVREAVLAGRVAEGERLPAARALADALGVNVHTVLRAYAALRDEGLLELRRGRGATVRTGEADRLRAQLDELTHSFVRAVRERGLDDDGVLRLVRAAL
jgi:DNA-binding transcriptional regulator YhcF (GntR family)